MGEYFPVESRICDSDKQVEQKLLYYYTITIILLYYYHDSDALSELLCYFHIIFNGSHTFRIKKKQNTDYFLFWMFNLFVNNGSPKALEKVLWSFPD